MTSHPCASRSDRKPPRSFTTALVAGVLGLAASVAGADPAAGLLTSTPAAPAAADPTAARVRVAAAYGRVPLAFEANRGQHAAAVDFLARGSGYALWLTPTEAVFALRATRDAAATSVRMQLVDSDAGARARGARRQAGVVNHYRGNDPRQWRTVPTFAEVQYDDVYPGIDLVYYGKQGQLEYDFVVAPGAAPSAIALRFAGVDATRVAFDGALLLTAGGTTLRWAAPVTYQLVDGERRAVPSAYRLAQRPDGTTTVGFTVGAYDAAHPLVIDPTLTYSTYLGGSDNDRGDAIVVDAAGQAHVTGYTVSIDFPASAGAYQPAQAGGLDVFVTKLDVAGAALLYSTYFGGAFNDDGKGIALDADGDIYVTGRTSSVDFPVTIGAWDVTHNGSLDGFVFKLDGPTGLLVYSTYLGSDTNDEPQDLAVDTQGRAYVVGKTQSATFPTTAGAFDVVYNGGAWDAFVTRLNAAGTNLSYSTFLGGSGFDYGNGIVLSGTEAYVTGYTTSNNYPTVAGSYDTSYNGGGDVFVSKLDTNGAALPASTFIGGAGTDAGEDIGRGGQGHVFVTGWASVGYPTTAGAYDTTHNGGTDVLVTKLNGTLAALTYSTFVGGATNDYGYGIAVNAAAGALVTGYTSSAAFPTVAPTQAVYGGGVNDAFVLRVQPTGAGLNFSTFLGGIGYEYAEAIGIDSTGNAYVTGVCTDVNFPTVVGSYDLTYGGGAWDAFVSKFTM